MVTLYRLLLAVCAVCSAQAASTTPSITLHADQLATVPPFIRLGVEVDPYDSFGPLDVQWNLIFQRLDYMGSSGRVEPALD